MTDTKPPATQTGKPDPAIIALREEIAGLRRELMNNHSETKIALDDMDARTKGSDIPSHDFDYPLSGSQLDAWREAHAEVA